MPVTRVLLTGFEPFGGESVNPSWTAATSVAAAAPPGLEVTAVELPCAFGSAADELRAAVERTEPDLALCLGQAGGRTDLTIERVAVNIDDALIPDNAGKQPVDEPIVQAGPAAYFAPLPVKACVAAAREAGVPASVSHTAGTFVCNHVFYTLAHLIASERPGMRGGFVHVPYAPEQALARSGTPSMPVPLMAEGLRAILTAAAATPAGTDLRVSGGTTH